MILRLMNEIEKDLKKYKNDPFGFRDAYASVNLKGIRLVSFLAKRYISWWKSSHKYEIFVPFKVNDFLVIKFQIDIFSLEYELNIIYIKHKYYYEQIIKYKYLKIIFNYENDISWPYGY